jgi:predicted Ser/Thr protein kinase
MQVGGERMKLVNAHPQYNFPRNPDGTAEETIPKNAELLIDVELLSVGREDMGLVQERLVSGHLLHVPPASNLEQPPSNQELSPNVLVIFWAAGLSLVSFAFRGSRSRQRTGQSVAVNSRGIEFGEEQNKQLLERLQRSWSDLHAVDLEGVFGSSDIRNWKGLPGCFLTFDFKSGGGADLDLGQMSRKEVENLLLCIERSADQSVLSKRALLFERQLLAADNDVPASYTAIWTDALESQFGATHFTPLGTGTALKSGRYQIRMQLASGGLSAVYLAQEKRAGMVVIKESVLPLDTKGRTRAKAKELFEREAEILAKLNHPQIAKVLDYFDEDGRDYIVLQYIPGASLRQLVAAEPEKVRKNINSWAAQMANILLYLHELEPPIIHRDLTPDNLLVGTDDRIALIDFGASNEFVGSATGTLIGKQAYIPPEQFRGKAEPKSDIYAFGATLYFLLTGKDPVPLSNSHPGAVLRTVPPELDDLVARCTRLDSPERPDAKELVEICERALTPGATAKL